MPGLWITRVCTSAVKLRKPGIMLAGRWLLTSVSGEGRTDTFALFPGAAPLVPGQRATQRIGEPTVVPPTVVRSRRARPVGVTVIQ
jgi:hypothetical protein